MREMKLKSPALNLVQPPNDAWMNVTIGSRLVTRRSWFAAPLGLVTRATRGSLRKRSSDLGLPTCASESHYPRLELEDDDSWVATAAIGVG